MNLQAKLDDAVTEIACELVENMAHRAFTQYGVTISKCMRDRLIDDLVTRGVTLG